jgi:hypothetical protein
VFNGNGSRQRFHTLAHLGKYIHPSANNPSSEKYGQRPVHPSVAPARPDLDENRQGWLYVSRDSPRQAPPQKLPTFRRGGFELESIHPLAYIYSRRHTGSHKLSDFNALGALKEYNLQAGNELWDTHIPAPLLLPFWH